MKRSAFVIAALGVATSIRAAAEPPPKEIPSIAVLPRVREVREIVDVTGLTDEVVIEGNYMFPGWALVAKRIRFRSGAKLVFSEEALALNNELLIAAQEIVAEDAAHPGTITWARGDWVKPEAGEVPG